jgi:hypothetical protein
MITTASVQLENKITGRESQAAFQDELICGKPPVFKVTLTLSQVFRGPIWKYGSYRQSVVLLDGGRGLAVSQCRYLHRATQRQKKCGGTSMPRVGFEPAIPVFERAKTFHALGRAATLIGGVDKLMTETVGRTTSNIQALHF